MTKAEATQLLLEEYASWVQDTIADDKYFYEYATEEPELYTALETVGGLLPDGLTVDINVTADQGLRRVSAPFLPFVQIGHCSLT